MPITTEKQRPPAKPGRWRWVALAAALVVLSLPLVLTLFPGGVRAGGHGIRGAYEGYEVLTLISRDVWTARGIHTARIYRVGSPGCRYRLELW